MHRPPPSPTVAVMVVSLPMKPKRILLDLLVHYRGETASGKLLLIGQLREYVKRQDPYILKDEIDTVDNEQDLNVLMGVGIKGFLWYEVIKQKARCIGQ